MASHRKLAILAVIALVGACKGDDKAASSDPAAATKTNDEKRAAAMAAAIGSGSSAGSGSGSAKPAAVKPPSTGTEMIKPKIKPPTPEEARAVLGQALVAAGKKQCDVATRAMVQAAFDFAQIDAAYVKANEPGLLALARCAEGQRFYRFMNAVALDVYRTDPKFHPELLARAMLGMGEYKIALDILKRAAKAAPKDGDISLTVTKAACKLEVWPECAKIAGATLKLVTPATTPVNKEIAWRADKYLARAMLHTGKFADATKAVAQAKKLGGSEKDLDEIDKLVATASRHKMLVEVTTSAALPIGGYHLFGKVKSVGSVAMLKVSNLDTKPTEVRVEAEISGITELATKTVTVLPGKTEAVELNPPLKSSFDVGTIRADMPSQLVLRVTKTDGNDVAYDESESITILPRDTLPLMRMMRDGEVHWTAEFVGAWVTPNAKAVDAFLAAAKKRLPPGQSFSGNQSPTLPQVKAIYDELHERGMSYVMDPDLFVDGSELVQRTRLPSDVLASTNAQCIEGAILYATLLEAIGLRPVITLAKGHSWVGWHPEGHDTPPSRSPKLYWLETTVTHRATFEQALATGDEMFYVKHARDWLPPPRGAVGYGWVDIAELRAKGITPQPWDR